MRAAPPLEIDVVRFGIWRAGTLALAATVWATLAIWWWAHPAPTPVWVSALAALGMLGATAAALPSFRARPFRLLRSAGQWQLVFLRDAPAPALTGDLLVALDLGAWMLLRFIPDATGRGARWIAVQRHGLEPQWHTLRCAIYAPRQKQPAEGAAVDV
ncbi:MAG: hypothetical protein ABI633_07405 [Burkholderiales bacterium]